MTSPRICATCPTTSSPSTSRTTRRDLFGLRFQHATGELENTAGLRASKRELARALTIDVRAPTGDAGRRERRARRWLTTRHAETRRGGDRAGEAADRAGDGEPRRGGRAEAAGASGPRRAAPRRRPRARRGARAEGAPPPPPRREGARRARAAQSREERQAERDALRAPQGRGAPHRRALKARAAKPAERRTARRRRRRARGRAGRSRARASSSPTRPTRRSPCASTPRGATAATRRSCGCSKTLHAHDERNEAHEGDLVRVVETRPLSATKRWRLTEVLERAQ